MRWQGFNALFYSSWKRYPVGNGQFWILFVQICLNLFYPTLSDRWCGLMTYNFISTRTIPIFYGRRLDHMQVYSYNNFVWTKMPPTQFFFFLRKDIPAFIESIWSVWYKVLLGIPAPSHWCVDPHAILFLSMDQNAPNTVPISVPPVGPHAILILSFFPVLISGATILQPTG